MKSSIKCRKRARSSHFVLLHLVPYTSSLTPCLAPCLAPNQYRLGARQYARQSVVCIGESHFRGHGPRLQLRPADDLRCTVVGRVPCMSGRLVRHSRRRRRKPWRRLDPAVVSMLLKRVVGHFLQCKPHFVLHLVSIGLVRA